MDKFFLLTLSLLFSLAFGQTTLYAQENPFPWGIINRYLDEDFSLSDPNIQACIEEYLEGERTCRIGFQAFIEECGPGLSPSAQDCVNSTIAKYKICHQTVLARLSGCLNRL